MKINDIYKDVALVVGCTIGVGFLSGKEIVSFVGNYTNAIILAVIFIFLNVILRCFCCYTYSCSVSELTKNCFGRLSPFFETILDVCYFVCMVIVLAGCEECLQGLTTPLALPLFSIGIILLTAFVQGGGLKRLQQANVVAIALVIVCFATLTKQATPANTTQVTPLKTLVYALFSVTMSLSVLTKASCVKSIKQNVICSVIAGILLLLLTCFALRLSEGGKNFPTLSGVTNPWAKILLIVTITLCGVTCVVSNGISLHQATCDLLPCAPLRNLVIYGLAIAFSTLGFDVLMKYGYLFIAFVGIAICVKCAIKNPLLKVDLKSDIE